MSNIPNIRATTGGAINDPHTASGGTTHDKVLPQTFVVDESSCDATPASFHSTMYSGQPGAGPIGVTVKQPGRPDWVRTGVAPGEPILPLYRGKWKGADYDVTKGPITIEISKRGVPFFWNTNPI